MPSLGLKLSRAVGLRCPRCGARGSRASWFKLALAMPLLFYPLSQTIWLAFDLHIRPSEPGDTAAARRS